MNYFKDISKISWIGALVICITFTQCTKSETDDDFPL
ncbi:MAG: hypothetical protein JWQ25_1725, partial [Daejeonella sp.]|nr:hypothetical protein [Daejeonella sp.]